MSNSNVSHNAAVSLSPADASNGLEEYPEPESAALRDLLRIFRKFLRLPDPAPVYIALACVMANLLPGLPPVWVMLVGAASSGKTVILMALLKLRNMHLAGDITKPALLSGTPAKDMRAAGGGGLLRRIGEFGMLLLKDFGSVLNLHHEARAALLAALREIFDGQWVRDVGSDGSKTLSWSGKLGILAGATHKVDKFHSLMVTMGERFVYYRMPPGSGELEADKALLQSLECEDDGQGVELQKAVAHFFKDFEPPEDYEVTPLDRRRIVDLAAFIARARGGVERDSSTRKIDEIPDPEMPARLSISLGRLFKALLMIGVGRRESWRVLTEVAWSSMPRPRPEVLRLVIAAKTDLGTPEILKELERRRFPEQTVRRAIEDLTVLGILMEAQKNDTEKKVKKYWRLSRFARRKYNLGFQPLSPGGES